MFSMCSELTPHARIPDTRIPQFMQPCTRTGQNEYKSKINKHWMQNNFCFLCKNQNMQRQEIDFTKLCWKFFLHFYLLQSSWNFVLARADIYHSNLRLSLFTQCCSYISSIHIIAYMMKETQKNGCFFTVQIICMRQNVIDLQEKFQRDNFLMKDE